MLNYRNLKDTWRRAVNLVSTRHCRLQNLILDIDQSRSAGIVGFRLSREVDLPWTVRVQRAPTQWEVVRALVSSQLSYFIALIRLQ